MVRINAVLSEELVNELDDIAREEHKNRSELLREAAGKLVEEYHRKHEELRRMARMQQAAATQDRLRKKSGKWNGVAEVRKWRDKTK